MENSNVIEDFNKSIKVLESCLNLDQINSSDNYFDLFVDKWSHIINEERMNQFYNIYVKLKFQKESEFKNKK